MFTRTIVFIIKVVTTMDLGENDAVMSYISSLNLISFLKYMLLQ